MQYNLFVEPLLISFALTVSACLILLSVPFFRERIWRRGRRHSGKRQISRLGGTALLVGFFLAVLFDEHLVVSREIIALLFGGVVVGLVGIWDDFQELSFKTQGFFQVILTALLFVFGVRITIIKNPFGEVIVLPEQGILPLLVGFVLLLLWISLVLNAVNWLDGLDGLLGSVTLITLVTIFFLSLKPEVNQPPVALLALMGIGVTAGFLVFNLHPARILAGTSGALFLGFLIAALSVIAGTKIATSLLVLALPIADALWVIGERLQAGVSIFQADQRHLHYRLRNLGWGESQIMWFFSLLTGIIAIIALSTQALGKFFAILLVLGVIFSFLFFVAQKTKRREACDLKV